MFWKGSSTGAIFFPRKSHRSAFKLCSKKVERFTLLLVPSIPIENLPKRPGDNPRRKLKSHGVWTVKMCTKIHTCQLRASQLLFNHVVNDIQSFFSLTVASHPSCVGWFSRALAFRSRYYPWGKMGITRSLVVFMVGRRPTNFQFRNAQK